MPTFFIVDGVKIEFYYNDHVPPHFHATIAEFEALIEIETATILRGDLPKNKRKKILKWATENETILMEIWEQMRSDN